MTQNVVHVITCREFHLLQSQHQALYKSHQPAGQIKNRVNLDFSGEEEFL